MHEHELPPATIEGRLLSASGRPIPEGIIVWFAHRTVDGEAMTVETTSDAEGRFVFELPTERLQSATIGAGHEGVTPVDLEPGGASLEAGDVVLIVDDAVPSHLRYGCL